MILDEYHLILVQYHLVFVQFQMLLVQCHVELERFSVIRRLKRQFAGVYYMVV